MLGHDHGVLFFSGGKDSLACLLLLREHWDRITVVWSNPGAPHAETVAYMDRIRSMVPHFVELNGRQPEWIAAHGWPVDVVPVKASSAGAIGFDAPKVRMASFLDCCSANLWEPMRQYVIDTAPTLIIRGQRADESPRNRMTDAEVTVLGTVTYWHPLHDWTAAQVKEYIQAAGWELPPFYDIGAESSPDCWNCTAYIDHNRSRLRWMRRERPQMFAQIEPVLDALSGHLEDHIRDLAEVLSGNHDP